MFIREHIVVSRGWSLIGRARVLKSWPSPLVPKFPSKANFGDNRHVAFGMSQGFLNFSKIKYLGSDFISGKAIQFWHYLIENRFSKKICRIGLFGDYQFHIALVGLDLEPRESEL